MPLTVLTPGATYYCVNRYQTDVEQRTYVGPYEDVFLFVDEHKRSWSLKAYEVKALHEHEADAWLEWAELCEAQAKVCRARAYQLRLSGLLYEEDLEQP